MVKNKWNQFWEWMFDRDSSTSQNSRSHWEASRAKASIITVVGFIVITAIVMLAVWIDNYIKYHF